MSWVAGVLVVAGHIPQALLLHMGKMEQTQHLGLLPQLAAVVVAAEHGTTLLGLDAATTEAAAEAAGALD